MRQGILQAEFFLTGGLLLVATMTITAALLVARMGLPTLALSVALAADDTLEIPDIDGEMGYSVNIHAAIINHQSVAFDYSSSNGGSWDIYRRVHIPHNIGRFQYIIRGHRHRWSQGCRQG